MIRSTRTLKIGCLVVLLSLMCINAFAQAQKATVKVTNSPISKVLELIEKQTDYRFSYRNVVLGNQQKVTVDMQDVAVPQILDKVFAGKNLGYNIVSNKSIVIFEKTAKGSQKVASVIKGKVIDGNGEPLMGASVMVDGTNNGVVTDLDGRFSFSAHYGDKLNVAFMGFTTKSVIAAEGDMTITLEEDNQYLDEIVVVGYGSTKKRDLIASVSTVKTDEITNVPVTNLAQGLAGRSPGLIVVQSGGGVNTTPTISIRGGGDPLYVIDGVVRSSADFNTLSPEEIETMSILKDASATAVYGSRASNGIIQVTTKTGLKDAGKAKLEYDFNYSMAQPANWPEQYGSYDRAIWANVARANDGFEPQYDENALNMIQAGTDQYYYGDWRLRDLMLNKWAPQTKHSARISGGNDKQNYFASIGNTDQQSLYNTGSYWMKRTNFRLSETTHIKPIGLHITASLDGYRETTNHPLSWGCDGPFSVFSNISNWITFTPVLNKYGDYLSGGNNPMAFISNEGGYDRTTRNVINGRGELVWDCLWVEGLKVRLAGNYRYGNYVEKKWTMDPPRYAWDSQIPDPANDPRLRYSTSNGYGFTTQAFLEYANTFGKHSISALGGYERYYEFSQSFWTQRENFHYDIDQIEIGDSNSSTNGGSEAELGRAAWIGSAKYSYGGKYFIEGNMRYDGSDYFAPGKRWGLFFSGAVGWIVSEEAFMKTLKDRNILNTLKLRASYGMTGLDSSAGRFAYLTSYNLNSKSLVVDGGYTQGLSEGALPSPDLTWYSTRQTDIGFDFASLAGRLYGAFDYFYYSTKGYLVAPKGEGYINTAIGVSMPKVKSDSEFRRSGIELQLGYKDHVGDFYYDIMGTFTYFDQMWAYDQSESESSYMNPYTRTQQQRGYYGVMYHNLGYYTDAADVMNSPAYISAVNSGYLNAGDIKYEDTNGDGQITSADSRRVGRNSFPRGQYGLNINLAFKGFYLNALFQGSTSFDLYADGQQSTADLTPVLYEYQTDAWTRDNVNAKFPRLTSNKNLNLKNNYLSSDFWLINGAYLRFKDFQFGYDFKGRVLNNVKWISKLKVGISGQNIFTISQANKYGIDPETSSTLNYTYPVERTLALTVNVGF